MALDAAIDGALIHQDAAPGKPFTDFGVTEAVATYQRTARAITSSGKPRPENAELERRPQ